MQNIILSTWVRVMKEVNEEVIERTGMVTCAEGCQGGSL